MFEPLKTEIGQRLRVVAIVLFVFNTLLSILGGILFMLGKDGPELLLGLLIMLAGILSAWCVSMLAYGFARLVENSEIVAENRTRKPLRSAGPPENARRSALVQQEGELCCAACGAPNEAARTQCWSCGAYFHKQDNHATADGNVVADMPKRVRVVVTNGEITCPVCAAVQNASRSACYKCGAEFVKAPTE